MKLTKRTILITGGTSGIGFELARQLLARENTVLITGRDAEKLEEAKGSLNGAACFISDQGNPEAIHALRQDVLRQFPTLDTVINNAGLMRNLDLQRDLNLGKPLEEITREIDVNLSGPIRMVQEFLPHLQRQRSALLVNVSSGLAFLPLPVAPVYCATKAALHSFTQSLRIQLHGTSVTVVEVAPPGTETPLFRQEFAAEMGKQKGMKVEELVGKIIRGVEAGKLEIRPGIANVLRLASRIAPGFMLKQMARMSVGTQSSAK